MSRILVLEDDIGFRNLLAETLRGAGHEVVLAQTGLEAISLAAERPINLLLVDNRMPGNSGPAFLNRFRDVDPNTPIIVMTAHGDVPVMLEAVRLGAIDFLVKPFNLDSLLPLVERLLGTAARPNTG